MRTSRCPLVLIGIGYANVWGGVLLELVGCSFGRNSLQPPRVLHRRLCPAGSFGNDRVMFLVLYDCGEFLDEGIGSIH